MEFPLNFIGLFFTNVVVGFPLDDALDLLLLLVCVFTSEQWCVYCVWFDSLCATWIMLWVCVS